MVGVILCGGRSQRMGEKKEYLKFADFTLADYQAKKMKANFEKLYFSSKESVLNSYNIPTIFDNSNIYAPIFGLCSSLEFIDDDIFVLAVDTPFFVSFTRLINSFYEMQRPTFAKSNSKIHPLIGIYPKDSINVVKKHIQENNYKLQNLLISLNADYVSIDLKETQNLNYKEDYKEALRMVYKY